MRRRIELEAEAAKASLPAGERITVGEYATEYLERMESGGLLTKSGRRFKASSISTARGQLNRFKAAFGMEGRWQLSLGAKVQGETGTVESKLVITAQK